MLRSVSSIAGPPDSPEFLAALRAASTVDVCARCEAPENQGLCHSEKCRKQVLPTMRGPGWQKDAHRGDHDTDVQPSETVWSATVEAIDKSQRRQRQLDANTKLSSALNGAFTRNRRARAA